MSGAGTGSSRPLTGVQETDGQRPVQGKPAIPIECARLPRSGCVNGEDGVEPGKTPIDKNSLITAVAMNIERLTGASGSAISLILRVVWAYVAWRGALLLHVPQVLCYRNVVDELMQEWGKSNG